MLFTKEKHIIIAYDLAYDLALDKNLRHIHNKLNKLGIKKRLAMTTYKEPYI